MSKILGLDWGTKRIGVSISDRDGKRAFPRGIILNDKNLFTKLRQLIEDESVKEIVLGLPLNLQGASTPQTEKVKEFAEALVKQCNLPIAFEDERLSTSGSLSLLREAKKWGKRRRQEVDQQAAQLILQGFLDRHA